MPFTRYNDPKIENEILRQLNLIVSHLLHYKRKLKIVSIVLGGSFGRGEGSVIVKNGRIKTLNDYDIFIVVKNSMLQYYVNYVLLEKSLKYLYKKYPYLPYIEFFLIKKNELHKLPPKVLYYELKHGSKILYGDNVLKEIRNYQPKDIPLIEGVILLFNRAVSLLYAYLASCCGRKERAIEQCVKGILGCGEALLILSRNYHFSFEKRKEIFSKIFPSFFSELYTKIPHLVGYYNNKATMFKLFPNYEIFQVYKFDIFWKEIVTIFLEVFKYYLKSYCQITTDDLYKLMSFFLKKKGSNLLESGLQWLTYSGQLYINSKIMLKPTFWLPPLYNMGIASIFLLNALTSDDPHIIINNLELTKDHLRRLIDVPTNENITNIIRRILIIHSRGKIKE